MTKKNLHEKLQKFPRYSLSILWAIIVLAGCLIDPRPFTEDLPPIFGLDKVAHFLMYFILAGLFLWEYNHRQFKGEASKAKQLFWAILLISCIYGGLIEYLQGLTSYRGMDEMDLVADVAGALFAYLFYFIVIINTKKDDKKL